MRPNSSRRKFQGRPFLASLLFPIGFLIPVLATIFVAIQSGSGSFFLGLWNAQRGTPWLWMVDVLPILLGLLGRFLATPSSAGNRSSSVLFALLTLTCLFPSAMMLYAWQEARGSANLVRTTRLAGTLQTLALRAYLHQGAKSGRAREEIIAMSQIRKEIKATFPREIQVMDPAWQAFYLEATKQGKPSLYAAQRMQEAAEKLTRTLENESRSSHTETTEILLLGVLGTLICLGLTLQLFNQLRQVGAQLAVSSKQQTVTSKQLESTASQLEETTRRLESVNTQLEQTTTRDTLTSVYNRRALDERIEMEWNRSLRYNDSLSILLIDIDYFKAYNDSFGQQAGDAVLQTIGALLGHSVRAADFPARYTNEKFLILLPHTTEEEAVRLAERIRGAVQVAPWKNRTVTVSIGVAGRAGSMTQFSELIDAADVALYQAKKTRNRVCRALTDMSTEQRKAA